MHVYKRRTHFIYNDIRKLNVIQWNKAFEANINFKRKQDQPYLYQM